MDDIARPADGPLLKPMRLPAIASPGTAAILIVIGVGLVPASTTTGCSRSTHLTPLDQQLVVGARRADAFIVTRQDGGMPRADRLLAGSACDNLSRVLEHSGLDAGAPCP